MLRCRLDRDMISGQSKGCALSIQVRYTRFVWFPQWAQERDVAKVDIKLFAPETGEWDGYRCVKFKAKVYR